MKISVLLHPSQSKAENEPSLSTEEHLIRLMIQEIEARRKQLKPKAFRPKGASKK